MKIIRTWFTPGSLVCAMIVALFWLQQLPMLLVLRELAQIGLLCLTYAGLWALMRDRNAMR